MKLQTKVNLVIFLYVMVCALMLGFVANAHAAKIDLTRAVTGTLPLANGGTGSSNTNTPMVMSTMICDGTTDNTTALQNDVNNLNANGGTILIPVGTGSCNVNGTITVNKAIRFLGMNSAVNNGSSITETTASTNLFYIQTIQGVQFSHLTLYNSTGGTAVILDGSASNNSNTHSLFEDVIIQGGAYGVYSTRSVLFSIEYCYFFSQTSAAVYVQNIATAAQDNGDSTIYASAINSAGGGTGIMWVGSGGLRIENNKILGGTVGIDIAPSASVATSDLLIYGNSIENNSYGIILEAGGGGAVGNVVIANNQLAIQSVNAISSGTNNIHDIMIDSNSIATATAGVTNIAISGGTRLGMFGNQIWDSGSGTIWGVNISGGVNIQIGDNQWTGVTLPVNVASTNVTLTGSNPYTFSNLPSTIANGSMVYCSDCTQSTTNATCTGSSTGAYAFRLGGAWKCN